MGGSLSPNKHKALTTYVPASTPAVRYAPFASEQCSLIGPKSYPDTPTHTPAHKTDWAAMRLGLAPSVKLPMASAPVGWWRIMDGYVLTLAVLGVALVVLAYQWLKPTPPQRVTLATGPAPELIVGHGVLGRLLARLCIANGLAAPVVWERNPQRQSGAAGYRVCDPDADARRDYSVICDVSGDSQLLNNLITRLAHGGEIAFEADPVVLNDINTDKPSITFTVRGVEELTRTLRFGGGDAHAHGQKD